MKNKKNIFLLTLGLLTLAVVALAFTLARNGEASHGDSDNVTSFVPFVAVIPAIYAASQGKKNKKISKKTKNLLFILLTLGIIMLAFTFFIWFSNV